MMLRCLVVDDEPLALDVIEDYIAKVDFLTLAARCNSALKALEVLHSEEIDVLFLDIQMPELTGFDMLESLGKRPWVVFTTAYDTYAVKSYDIDAVDYLLKPFSFARFLKAIQKIVEYNGKPLPTPAPTPEKDALYIFVSAGGKTTRLAIRDIVYIKGLSDYIEIVTERGKLIVYESLKNVLVQLEGSGFMRVHKSWVVPIHRIDTLEGNSIRVAGTEIPIGRTYRKELIDKIESIKIGK